MRRALIAQGRRLGSLLRSDLCSDTGPTCTHPFLTSSASWTTNGSATSRSSIQSIRASAADFGRSWASSRGGKASCSYHASAAAHAQPARAAAAPAGPTKRRGRSSKHAAESEATAPPVQKAPSTNSTPPAEKAEPAAAMAQAMRAKTGGRYQLPPEMSRPQTLKQAPISPNLLAEPYRGGPPPLPASAWLSLSGYKERWRRTLSGLKSMYTLAKCRKHIPGFSLPGFKAEALVLYEDVCRAVASDDKSALRQKLTPVEYSNVKAQLRARGAGGWARVAWRLGRRPALHELELVHARLMAVNPKDDKAAFAQLTVRVRAAHVFAAYDGEGRAVAGDAAREVPVQDVWVFERFLTPGPTSRWRVAGRLSLPPVPPPKERWWNPMGWLRSLRPAPDSKPASAALEV